MPVTKTGTTFLITEDKTGKVVFASTTSLDIKSEFMLSPASVLIVHSKGY